MSMRSVFFLLGCAVAWLVLLPIMVIGGGVALLAYALGAEAVDAATGRRGQPDAAAASEIAKRLCDGHY